MPLNSIPAMHIIRPQSTQRINQPLALTLGNFDGVHRGHQALLDQLTKEAKQKQLIAGVIIFEPHASEYFAQKNNHSQPKARLLGLADKISQLRHRLDFMAIYRFNAHSIQIRAEQFIQNYLLARFNIKHILIGDDFRFGAERQGDLHLLKHYGKVHGFTVNRMPSYTEQHARISSTAIRKLLHQGQINQAKKCLGYDYYIRGRVIKGKQLGQKIGTPTANIQYRQPRLALSGVYLTWLEHKQQRYPSITHIGYNKTLEQPASKPQIETHLLKQHINLYGAKVSITFIQKLREEQKFPNIASLQEAIAQDKKQALAYFYKA